MKRSVSILFMTIAMLTIIMHSVIPHHEHAEKVCFENILCNSSDDNKDAAGGKHSCCLEKQEVVRAQNEQESQSLCDHGPFCTDHQFVILFVGDFFESGTTLSSETKENPKPYLNLYTSVGVYSTNSLRAPPRV
ncbi:MAG: DUF6769 family protein [Dysgonomonas sp.]